MDYDKLLGIDTRQRDGRFPQQAGCHRYEATPYSCLDTLFMEIKIPRKSRLVDFGCGKGRVPMFFHYLTGSEAVGIDMDNSLCDDARINLANFCSVRKKAWEKIQFFCCMAQEYKVQPQDDLFYFFNPFSVGIFSTVVGNILASFGEAPRRIRIILYYPSNEYIQYLDRYTPFELEHEISLPGNSVDERERFSIWGMGEI